MVKGNKPKERVTARDTPRGCCSRLSTEGDELSFQHGLLICSDTDNLTHKASRDNVNLMIQLSGRLRAFDLDTNGPHGFTGPLKWITMTKVKDRASCLMPRDAW